MNKNDISKIRQYSRTNHVDESKVRDVYRVESMINSENALENTIRIMDLYIKNGVVN